MNWLQIQGVVNWLHIITWIVKRSLDDITSNDVGDVELGDASITKPMKMVSVKIEHDE